MVLWASLIAPAVVAGPLPPAVQAEIDGLLGRLEASGCAFDRNGTWYSAAEARAHLVRKLEYVQGRGMVQSAEQFIDLAASGSSATGHPYRVKCGSDAPVESGKWLRSRLQDMRTARSVTGAP